MNNEILEEKPAYYSILPANVRYDNSLCPNAILLYGEITALCNSKGYCWAKNEYFALLYGKSNETISRWISQLKKRGYINVVVNKLEGNTRKITIANDLLTKTSRPIDENVNTLLTKTSRPIDENVKSYIRMNNTINNKINNTHNSVRAIDFLKTEALQAYQVFEMQNRILISNWEMFIENFNDTIDIEISQNKIEFNPNQLMPRLKKYFRSWLSNHPKQTEAKSEFFVMKTNPYIDELIKTTKSQYKN